MYFVNGKKIFTVSPKLVRSVFLKIVLAYYKQFQTYIQNFLLTNITKQKLGSQRNVPLHNFI